MKKLLLILGIGLLSLTGCTYQVDENTEYFTSGRSEIENCCHNNWRFYPNNDEMLKYSIQYENPYDYEYNIFCRDCNDKGLLVMPFSFNYYAPTNNVALDSLVSNYGKIVWL